MIPHPAFADEVRAISVRVERVQGALKVGFTLEADLSRIALPEPGPARRGDKLWQHTCFEVFVSPGMPAYREFNFSPSGEWAAYAFRRYREAESGGAEVQSVAVRRSAATLELDAAIPAPEGRLSIAISAVVESKSGALSYWALKHPAGKPDFHHPEAFALEL
ncbi:MAG TPA: DOMON-like domain-containing protein [Burkholderiales bacterium]|nr:DOMON-like domain-containing protein [Burkholderiales bacterium]